MQEQIVREIALAALQVGAIRLQPKDPFTWTTGYRMPIYNDNRKLVSHYENRKLVAESFCELIKSEGLTYDLIAATAIGGICPATAVADLLKARICYVRPEAKGHGLKNRVEGILETGEQAILIEDLVSTGSSSIAALQGLRDAGARVENCLAIFTYGFKKADDAFTSAVCKVRTLLNYEQLIKIAREAKYISVDEERCLVSWQEDPFGWGEKNGFPKIEKQEKL